VIHVHVGQHHVGHRNYANTDNLARATPKLADSSLSF
jgi:hypothetical protein